jgi:phage-related protein
MPATVRRELGFDLRRVQRGELPRDWKPIPSVGGGVVEIRVHVGGAFRLMYVARHVEGIYVLHVFQKKSRKTASLDIALARARLARVRRSRNEE